ncbi:MAG: histone H1 [Bacteroidota bacterium]
MKKLKQPKDPNERAKLIVDLATSETLEKQPISVLNVHAVELGRLGGLKGGKARAKKLTKRERIRIAKLGAQRRWSKKGET